MDPAARSLPVFDIERLLAPVPPRTNIYVANIDGRFGVRTATIADTFPAHRHPDGDEGWFVYRGGVRIDSELGSAELRAGQGTVVPAGTRHSPTALEPGTIVLVFNRRDFQTIAEDAAALAAAGYSEHEAAE
jgi:mannose-6-phosphate isomerase-like protein (cupin superfamily)